MNTVLFGESGSGKSSGPGKSLMEAILKDGNSGGLILVPKPEGLKALEKILGDKVEMVLKWEELE